MIVSPRHVLCLLGNWTDFSPIEEQLHAEHPGFTLDTEYSQLVPDSRMARAFEVSQDRVHPTMTGADWRAVDEHSAVVYILSPHLDASNSEQISGMSLQLIASLLSDKAVAAKSESAGLVHGKDQWIAFAQDYTKAVDEGDLFSAGATLYAAWVQRCLQSRDEGSIYSVGMHLLGHRDIEYAGAVDPEEAIHWIDLLGYYLLADRPDRSINDGEGFRLASDGPRRVIRQVPCHRYESDDFFYNPYGYNRLVEETLHPRPWWRFW